MAFLLLAGCTSAKPAPSPEPVPSASAPDADASPELIAAIRRTAAASFTFTVVGRTKDGDVHRAGGVFDPQGGKLRYNLRVTGGPEANPYHDEILIGSNDWMRSAAGDEWIHMYQRKLAEDSPWRVDLKDPSGLGAFAERAAGGKVSRTGPNAFQGEFDVHPAGHVTSLPVGPAYLHSGSTAPERIHFKATTGGAGWVTAVTVEYASLGLKVPHDVYTTKLTGHGKPVTVRKPSDTAEADAASYRETL
ncbi:hypothetical protein [Actinoplanes sp. URMC 104]|uniref:hypothetical protein n=1 Tax=Actinoplanes sp. URMC 104 TaxID=3423409 RepID=UPI003F198205